MHEDKTPQLRQHARPNSNRKGHPMTHPENSYIQAGYKFEKGKTQAETLRHMLEAEHPRDRTEARRLIEQRRAEARQH